MKNWQKTTLWIIGFILIFALGDFLLGRFAKNYILSHPLHHKYATTREALLNPHRQVAVFGVSVGLSSVDTDMIADSLNVSAVNYADNGQRMPYHLTLLERSLSSENPPEAILLVITPHTLCRGNDENRFYALAPYYGLGLDSLDRRLECFGPTKKIFLQSSLYRFNSIWWKMLIYETTSYKGPSSTGFRPRPDKGIHPRGYGDDQAGYGVHSPSPEALRDLKRFLLLCQQSKIPTALILTPRYILPKNSPTVDSISKYCRETEIPLIDDTYLEPFHSNPYYFDDDQHLNCHGAALYTPHRIIPLVKDLLKPQSTKNTSTCNHVL